MKYVTHIVHSIIVGFDDDDKMGTLVNKSVHEHTSELMFHFLYTLGVGGGNEKIISIHHMNVGVQIFRPSMNARCF